MKNNNTIPGLDNALAVINCLSDDEPDGITSAELAKSLDIAPTTCYRILQTLIESNRVRCDGTRYEVSTGLLTLTRNLESYQQLLQSAQRPLEELANSTEMISKALPAMQKNKWGRIVTVGSVQQYIPHPKMAVYAALKEAQFSFAKTLAGQVAADGITINNLSPGIIETDRTRDALQNPDYCKSLKALFPSRKFGISEDCCGAILLLCSDASQYITGIDISVAGGMNLNVRP